MCFVSMDSNKENLMGRYTSKLYDSDRKIWNKVVIIEQVFFKRNFNL